MEKRSAPSAAASACMFPANMLSSHLLNSSTSPSSQHAASQTDSRACRTHAEVNMVLPGPETLPSTGTPSALAHRYRAKAAPSSKGLLEGCNAANFLPLFAAEQIGIPELLDLDFASLRAVFPRVPAGLLLRVQKGCPGPDLGWQACVCVFHG